MLRAIKVKTNIYLLLPGWCRIEIKGLHGTLRTEKREMFVMDNVWSMLEAAENAKEFKLPDVQSLQWLEKGEKVTKGAPLLMTITTYVPYAC